MRTLPVLFLLLPFVLCCQKAAHILDSANYYINHGRQLKAIKLLNGLKNSAETQPKAVMYKTYRLLGKALYDLGDPGKAAGVFGLGLELAKKNRDSLMMGDFYMLMGGVNIHGVSVLCLHQYNLAEELFVKLKAQRKLTILKLRRGTYYSFMGKTDSAEYFFRQVEEDCKVTPNDTLMVSVYINRGVAAAHLNQVERFKQLTLLAMALSKKAGDLRNYSMCCENYAAYLRETGQYDSCLYYARKGMRLADSIGFIRSKIVGYENLIAMYKARKDYRTALELTERFKIVNDSFRNADKDVNALKAQMDSEFKEKEEKAKLENLMKEQRAQQQLMQQRMIIFACAVVLLVIASAALVLYNRFRIIKRQKSIIESQQKVLQNKNTIIEEKQKEILDSIRYARRIQNSLLPSEKYIGRQLKK